MRSFRFVVPFLVLFTACSVYGDDVEVRSDGGASDSGRPDGGRSDGGGSDGRSGAGGAAGNGGTGGAGPAGSGGTSGGADAAVSDANRMDADAMITDTAVVPDASIEGGSDARETGPLDDGTPPDAPPALDADAADVFDTSPGVDATDVGPPTNDAPMTPDVVNDADAPPTPDADSGGRGDVSDSGPIGRQILPLHGSPIELPDAGGPFDSRCASDEVVTGFIGRAGVQTDAIASTCSRLIGGVLSSPRNLPLNGNASGGTPFTVTCPANYVAVGIVGRFGHNTMWNEDITTMIGVVCKALSSTTTQIVTITGQPTLDPGYSTFREDCTSGRSLTDVSGRTDSNSLGFTVQQVGGECEIR